MTGGLGVASGLGHRPMDGWADPIDVCTPARVTAFGGKCTLLSALNAPRPGTPSTWAIRHRTQT